MNQRTLPTRLAIIAVGVVVLFASPLPAMAQSCALCYTQAASAGSRMIEALKSGILILIVPPTLTSIGMVFIMYRNRNRCRDAADASKSDAIWNRTDLSIATKTHGIHPRDNRPSREKHHSFEAVGLVHTDQAGS
jgi:hypothetical protein